MQRRSPWRPYIPALICVLCAFALSCAVGMLAPLLPPGDWSYFPQILAGNFGAEYERWTRSPLVSVTGRADASASPWANQTWWGGRQRIEDADVCWPGGEKVGGPNHVVSGFPFASFHGAFTLAPIAATAAPAPPPLAVGANWTVSSTEGAWLVDTDPASVHRFGIARIIPYVPLWPGLLADTLLLSLPLIAVTQALLALRYHARTSAGRCGLCGYSMQHTGAPICPECGEKRRWTREQVVEVSKRIRKREP